MYVDIFRDVANKLVYGETCREIVGCTQEDVRVRDRGVEFSADSGLLAKLTQSVRDLESNSKSIILSWIMRRLEDCEKEKTSSCYAELCLESSRCCSHFRDLHVRL